MHQSIYLDMDRSLAGMVTPLGILDGEGSERRVGVHSADTPYVEFGHLRLRLLGIQRRRRDIKKA